MKYKVGDLGSDCLLHLLIFIYCAPAWVSMLCVKSVRHISVPPIFIELIFYRGGGGIKI